MTKAREIMTGGAEYVSEDNTVVEVARKLQQLDVGALPVRGADDSFKGMITDRDIVTKVLAAGRDAAATTAGSVADGPLVTVSPEDSVDQAIDTMMQHKIRRLPVVDGSELVGMISQADLATRLDETKAGEFLRSVSAAP